MRIELSAHSRLRALERLNINSEQQLARMAQGAMLTTNGIPHGCTDLKERFFKELLAHNIIKIFEGIVFIFCKDKTGLILKTVFPLHKEALCQFQNA